MMEELDQSASSAVEKEKKSTTSVPAQENGDKSPDLQENDDLLSLIISDSEGEEQETSIVPNDSTDSGLKDGENAPDITGIAPLDVTREAVSENNVGDSKHDDKEAKEYSSKEGDVGAAEKLARAQNDNIDLTGSSSSEESFICDRGEKKRPANQLNHVRNDVKKTVARATNVNTTAEELFNSLLGERSSAAMSETTHRADRSDMITFSDEVNEESSIDPAEMKQKAVDRSDEVRPSVEQTEIAQQTDMSIEAGKSAGTKRLTEKIHNVSGVTETAETNCGEVKIHDEDADGIVSQEKDANTVPTAVHEKRTLREAEKDVTEDFAKRAIEANKKDGLAVDEANDTQNDEHQVPIVSTSDEIAEPPRKKQKPSEVNSTGDEVAIVLSESLQETRNDPEHTSGIAFVSNSCELLSMNGEIKRIRSLMSEIKDDKTVEPNRSSSALNSAEMLPKKPTALEVLVIDDDDEDISNARSSEVVNDTKKCALKDSGKRDLHTSGLVNTDSKSSAKRAKMAECGTLSDERKSLPGVNPGTKNEEDEEKLRKEHNLLGMDFLKIFARPLKTMTRYDLEVLVMQKITEAIVDGEEMAEMRKLVAKQDAMLVAYRQRITDLSKRLSDITLIQNRVLTELDKRSNRQVLPVKITRNVGIQISVPRHWCNEVEEQPFRSVAGSTPPITGPKECLPNSPTNVTSANSASQTPQTNAAKSITAVPQSVANLNKHSGTNTARQPQTTSITRNSMVSSNGALPSNGGTSKQSVMAPSSDHRSTNTPNPKTTESSTSSSNTSVMNGNNAARNTSDSNQKGTRKSCHKFTPMRAPMSAQQQAQHLKHAREQQEYMVQQQIKCQQAQRQLQTLDASKTDQSKGNAARKSTSAESAKVHIPKPLPGGIRREAGPSSTSSRPTNSSLIDLTDEDDIPRKSTSAARPTLRMNTMVPTRASPNVVTSSTNGQLTRVSEQANQQRSQGTEKHVLNGQIRSSLSQKTTTTSAKSTMVAKVVPLQVNARRPLSRHPAPLPVPVSAVDTPTPNPAWGLPPPQPAIRIINIESGIVISWGMDDLTPHHAGIGTYQIYAYQETSETPTPESWRHVGNVDALNLPMAVTLTHFQEGQRYHFAVRAIDVHKRIGQFSEPRTWSDRQN